MDTEVLLLQASHPEFWNPVVLTFDTTTVSPQPHVLEEFQQTFCLDRTVTQTSEN